MSAGQTKDVNVKLNIGLGADGDRALKTLSETINKAAAAAVGLAKAAQQNVSVGGDTFAPPIVGPSAVGRGISQGGGGSILNKLGMGGIAGRMGHIQGYGQGLQELGFARLGGALANPFVAGVGAVGIGAANLSAKLAASASDTYLTADQRGRAAFRDIVPFGSHIQGWADAFSGRAAAMQRADVASQLRRADMTGVDRLAQWQVQNNPTYAGQVERSNQLAGASAITMDRIDQTTAAGRVRFQEESRLLPVRRELAKAQREEAVATKERVAAEQELYKASSRSADLEKRRAEAQARLDADTGSGAGRQRLIREANDASAAVQANAELLIQARTNVSGAVGRQAAASQQTAGARAGVLEAQAANLEARAGRIQSGAESFGMMDPFERGFAVDAVRAAQQHGLDALTPEMRSAAARAAPMTIAALAEKTGSANPEFRQLQKLAPDEFGGGTAQDNRDRAADLRAEAERTRLQGEASAARVVENSGRDLGTYVAEQIKKVVAEAKREIYHQLFVAKNQS